MLDRISDENSAGGRDDLQRGDQRAAGRDHGDDVPGPSARLLSRDLRANLRRACDLVQIQYKTADTPTFCERILKPPGRAGDELIPVRRPRWTAPATGQPMPRRRVVRGALDETQLTDALLDELFGSAGGMENASAGRRHQLGGIVFPGYHFLRFCYCDGYSWWDDWTIFGDNPLPQLIQVTIGFGERAPWGEEQGVERINEEFCTCMNQDPVECRPLLPDHFTAVVRVPGADPLFPVRAWPGRVRLWWRKRPRKGEDAMRSCSSRRDSPNRSFHSPLIGTACGCVSFRVHADAAATHGMSERLQTRLAAEAGVEWVKQILRVGRFDYSLWYHQPEAFHRVVVWAKDQDSRAAGTVEEFEEAQAYRFSIVADDPTDDDLHSLWPDRRGFE